MDGWVLVTFPTNRDVYVDSVRCGKTNTAFNAQLGTHFDTSEVDSLGGLVFARLGRKPQLGDEVEIGDGYRARVERLDGDEVRKELTHDLGFSREDRSENAARIAYVANLLTRQDVVVLVSIVSPFRKPRQAARARIGSYIEVFVNAPLEVCEQRDPKGLYRKARAGELKGFTGIDDPYEPPLAPEVECRTDQESVAESVAKVMEALRTLGYVIQ